MQNKNQNAASVLRAGVEQFLTGPDPEVLGSWGLAVLTGVSGFRKGDVNMFEQF